MEIKGIDLNVGFREMDALPVFDGDVTKLARAVNFAVSGLLTDGGHHKQWCLEQVLVSLGIDLEELRSALQEGDYGWEEGIAP
jgi:hypothetical protein